MNPGLSKHCMRLSMQRMCHETAVPSVPASSPTTNHGISSNNYPLDQVTLSAVPLSRGLMLPQPLLLSPNNQSEHGSSSSPQSKKDPLKVHLSSDTLKGHTYKEKLLQQPFVTAQSALRALQRKHAAILLSSGCRVKCAHVLRLLRGLEATDSSRSSLAETKVKSTSVEEIRKSRVAHHQFGPETDCWAFT